MHVVCAHIVLLNGNFSQNLFEATEPSATTVKYCNNILIIQFRVLQFSPAFATVFSKIINQFIELLKFRGVGGYLANGSFATLLECFAKFQQIRDSYFIFLYSQIDSVCFWPLYEFDVLDRSCCWLFQICEFLIECV